ncbi:MAG: hypothetical protein PHY54_19500 [Methylococcales bacterium]|nr:hypothetical protein [Methylococcales bacterium]
MRFNKSIMIVGLLLSLTTLNAEASLTAYTAAGNQSVVYSSLGNITWTGDANLLGTLENTFGFNTIVNAIISASPTIYDTPNAFDNGGLGVYNISTEDFSYYNGYTNWFGAQAFTKYLNSIHYAGSNQWVLPISDQFNHLFRKEMGVMAGSNFPNSANFTNQQSYAYWLSTEYAYFPIYASIFPTSNDFYFCDFKNCFNAAWAVSPGQVAAVPIPGAIWLFVSVLGLLSFTRRKQNG